MSDKEQHDGCNCGQTVTDEQLLANQAENKGNLAFMWLQKDRIDAADVHLEAAAKLIQLSGMKTSAAAAIYYAARAAIAQKRGQDKATLRHARKAYAIYKQILPAEHYSVCLAKANFGEALAIAENKEKGRQILAEGLEELKAADVGSNPGMIAWKESAIQEVTQTLASLS